MLGNIPSFDKFFIFSMCCSLNAGRFSFKTFLTVQSQLSYTLNDVHFAISISPIVADSFLGVKFLGFTVFSTGFFGDTIGLGVENKSSSFNSFDTTLLS